MSVCCEHGNEPSGSIKGAEFTELLSDSQCLRKDSVAWSSLVGLLVNLRMCPMSYLTNWFMLMK
jgi:hypothetical protein